MNEDEGALVPANKLITFIEKLPDWIRWVCILPALIVTKLIWLGFLDLIQLISTLGYYLGGNIYLTDNLKHFVTVFGEPIIAVLTVIYTAPKRKFIAGLIMGIYMAILAIAALIANIGGFFEATKNFDEPAWLLFFKIDFLGEPFWFIFLELIIGGLGVLIALLYVFIIRRKTKYSIYN